MQEGAIPSSASLSIHDPIEFEQEEDGRWIAEIPSEPGAMVYGGTRAEAESRVKALYLLIKNDRADPSSQAKPRKAP